SYLQRRFGNLAGAPRVQLKRAVPRTAARLPGRIAMTSLCAPLPPDAGDSVTLTIAKEPATSWRTSKHLITSDHHYERYKNLHSVDPSALPGIQPGQLWVVEQSSRDPHLSPLGRHALTSATVVIYDRALY